MKKNLKLKSFIFHSVLLFLILVMGTTQVIDLSANNLSDITTHDDLNFQPILTNQYSINSNYTNGVSDQTSLSAQNPSQIEAGSPSQSLNIQSETNSTMDVTQNDIHNQNPQQLPNSLSKDILLPQFLPLSVAEIRSQIVQSVGNIRALPNTQSNSVISQSTTSTPIQNITPTPTQLPITTIPITNITFNNATSNSEPHDPVDEQQKQKISTFISQKSNNTISKYNQLDIYQISPQNSLRRFEVIYQKKLSYKVIYYLIILGLSQNTTSQQTLKILQTGFRIYSDQLTQQQLIQYIINSNDKLNLIPKYQIINNFYDNFIQNFDTFIKSQDKIDLQGNQNVKLFQGDQPYYRVTYLLVGDQILSFQVLFDQVFNKIKIISKKISPLLVINTTIEDNNTNLINENQYKPIQLVTEFLNNQPQDANQNQTDPTSSPTHPPQSEPISPTQPVPPFPLQPPISNLSIESFLLDQTWIQNNSSSINQQLYQLLSHVQICQNISEIKYVTKNNVISTSDGKYYQLNVTTDYQLEYYIVIYSQPQYQYVEVMRYENVSAMPQQISQETVKKYQTKITILSSNILNSLQPILEYVSNNFNNQFSKSQIVSIFQSTIPQISQKFYRIILKTQNYYQLSLIKDIETIHLYKKTKLFDGYTQIDNNPSSQQLVLSRYILNIAARYLWKNISNTNQTKYFNFDWQDILVKYSSFGNYYRVIISLPVRNSAVIFVDGKGKIVFKDFQEIPNYYNDMLLVNNQYKYLGNMQNILTKYQTLKLGLLVSNLENSTNNLQRINKL